ncbi:homeodomain-interacting protein kinase 2-like isoform X2 [Drosophila montana]|uniref:homeodomain-interacting protein kinase 2-like isoform X2 n=1 Tax=Drosophila montana TaxID=40370 RepID=UPI00313F1AA4
MKGINRKNSASSKSLKHVVYVSWKRGKHNLGSLIKGRYFVEAPVGHKEAWLGWDIRKKRACLIKPKNIGPYNNTYANPKSVKPSKKHKVKNPNLAKVELEDAKSLVNPEPKGKLSNCQTDLSTKGELDNFRKPIPKTVESRTYLAGAAQIVNNPCNSWPKPTVNEKPKSEWGILNPADRSDVCKMQKPESWDVTQGGFNILPPPRAAAAAAASKAKSKMQKSESWDVTGGGINILPVRQSLVKAKVNAIPAAMSAEGQAGLARIPSSESWDVTQGGLKILPMPRGVAPKPNVSETPNWDISESESECSPSHYGGKMLPVPFSEMRGPQETPRYEVSLEETENAGVTPSENVQDTGARICPIPPSETPRWAIVQSTREKLPNESYRSPMVSDLPSWYMTKHGKKSATVRIGDLLHERYYILSIITISHLASVWLCWDLRSKCNVVMKMADTTRMSVQLIYGEINTIKSLHAYQPKDPRLDNIVRALDGFQLTRSRTAQPCLILEAMDTNLAKYAEHYVGSVIPLEVLKCITRRVLSGLEYLHSVGVVHADIKPENVLVTACMLSNCENCPDKRKVCSKLHIKIADFANSSGMNGCIAGEIQTRAYRCLESILGSDCGTPSDIWSVACMVFELAVGRFLFAPNYDNTISPEEHHLARIIELLGPIPHQIVFRGRDALRYFNPYGKLLNSIDMEPKSLVEVLMEHNWCRLNAMVFASFLTPMLEYEPKKRVTASKCLQHPWLI